MDIRMILIRAFLLSCRKEGNQVQENQVKQNLIIVMMNMKVAYAENKSHFFCKYRIIAISAAPVHFTSFLPPSLPPD
jgi:hypothetical protein